MAQPMAVDGGHSSMPNPGHTIYVNNLHEKIGQDGEPGALQGAALCSAEA